MLATALTEIRDMEKIRESELYALAELHFLSSRTIDSRFQADGRLIYPIAEGIFKDFY